MCAWKIKRPSKQFKSQCFRDELPLKRDLLPRIELQFAEAVLLVEFQMILSQMEKIYYSPMQICLLQMITICCETVAVT